MGFPSSGIKGIQHRPQTGLLVAVGPWTYIGSSNTAGIIDISMASGIKHVHLPCIRWQCGLQMSTLTKPRQDYGPRHGLQQQHEPRHHHGLGWQQKPLRSAWALVAAQPPNISAWFISMAYHRPQVSTRPSVGARTWTSIQTHLQ